MIKIILAAIILAAALNVTAAEAQSLRWHDGHYTDPDRRWKEHDYYGSRNDYYRHHHHDCYDDNDCGDDD